MCFDTGCQDAVGADGGGAAIVKSGDYLVTLDVGGTKMQQVLRVERVAGFNDDGAATEHEEISDEP